MADSENGVDMCPVCKSTPLTTPGLRFKIAPRCYHRICEGCVDRKFSSGKSECPISGCKEKLWKRDWKTQTFEDLQIEREIDQRRYVISVLDRKEEDFIDKRHYDDFLELREEFVMNLVLNMDVKATRKKIDMYKEMNGKASDVDASGLIQGLKKKPVAIPRSPYDPFMGMPQKRDYYELRSNHETRYGKFKSDSQFGPAGYDFQEYMDESLYRAFSGLGIFIEDELRTSSALPVRAAEKPSQASEDDVF